MQSQISNIMNDLVQNPSEAMPYQVQAMSQRRWLIEADPGPIVQLELLDDGRSALIYATTARDGSGPLRSSFITMLMLEDTIANVLVPYGVCSGDATATVYKRVSLANATAPGVFRQMMEFSQIASAVLAKRGIGLPGVISADDRRRRLTLTACRTGAFGRSEHHLLHNLRG